MKRIVAFGCSHTFGMGLEDCFLGEEQKFKSPKTSSKFAWPNLLANRFNVDCYNQSIPGGSNFEILQKIIEHEYTKDDIVVVGWTTPQRDILKNKDGNIRIAAYALDDRIKIDTLLLGSSELNVKQANRKYFDIHSDYDMMYKSWLCQYTAGLHLTAKKIPFHFSTAWGWEEISHPFQNFISIDNFIEKYKKENKLIILFKLLIL